MIWLIWFETWVTNKYPFANNIPKKKDFTTFLIELLVGAYLLFGVSLPLRAYPTTRPLH